MSSIRPGRRRTCRSAMESRSATRCTLQAVQGTISSDIEAETRSALANIKKVLDAAGFKPSDVVQVTVYLKDVNDFPKMNAAYREFFPDPKPTRTTVEVARLVNDAHIEITSVAVRSPGGSAQ